MPARVKHRLICGTADPDALANGSGSRPISEYQFIYSFTYPFTRDVKVRGGDSTTVVLWSDSSEATC